MTRSEALVKAQNRYERKIKTIGIRLNTEKDADILEKLEAIENKTDYIRNLIRKDMEG